MGFTLQATVLTIGLFFGTLLLLESGRRIGLRRLAQDAEGARAGFGVVGGAVFGLMGLLIAFTFSGAASRFDTRRQLVVEEANAIGTAYLRLDLLPASAQPALRESFRRYLDTRLAAYRKLPDVVAAKQELANAAELTECLTSMTHYVRLGVAFSTHSTCPNIDASRDACRRQPLAHATDLCRASRSRARA